MITVSYLNPFTALATTSSATSSEIASSLNLGYQPAPTY